MKTTTTLLAALLLAGASQAALAQEPGHDHGGDRPQVVQEHGGPNGGGHGGGGGGDHRGPDDRHPGGPPALAPAPQGSAIAPQGGHARFGAPPPPSAGPAPTGAPAQAAAAPPRGGNRDGDRHFDRGGDRNAFAPGATANGDRRWDRHDAPREVTPPANVADHSWDRDHDSRAGDGRRLSQTGRDGPNRDWDRDHNGDRGRWDQGRNGDHDRSDHRGDGDHRGPPPNWRHWQRGQTPTVYSASHRYRVGPYRPPYGWYVRAWGYGDVLPGGWYGPNFWIDDFYDYDLPWPPPGMHWVRVGDDALLVDDYFGRIVQVIRDMFW
jgi:hypothetical protein